MVFDRRKAFLTIYAHHVTLPQGVRCTFVYLVVPDEPWQKKHAQRAGTLESMNP